MEKQSYLKPEMKVFNIRIRQQLLAGSVTQTTGATGHGFSDEEEG